MTKSFKSETQNWKQALDTLDGLSVGDSFGDAVFGEDMALRALPATPWTYTDDTNTALSIVWCLRKFGRIEQDELAASLAEHYDPARGYGNSMNDFFMRLRQGENWREVSSSLFNGQGSFGNGAAMRVAPLGSFFSNDLEKVVEQAALSAEVTHSHAEGIAGAIAVAVAAAIVTRQRQSGTRTAGFNLADSILEYVPRSELRLKLSHAAVFPSDKSTSEAAGILGNGSKVTALDTVPFCLWCANKYLTDFQEALWQTAAAGGDVDTNCAIVGALVASYSGKKEIPSSWLRSREILPSWVFEED